eukprot:COSAG06_NODE_7282_length_2561_cov_1.664907_1_plen_96_part_10
MVGLSGAPPTHEGERASAISSHIRSGRRVAASAGGAKNGGWVGADKLALWAAICANCTLAAVQLLVMLCNGLGVGLLHRRDVGLAFLCAWVSACTR